MWVQGGEGVVQSFLSMWGRGFLQKRCLHHLLSNLSKSFTLEPCGRWGLEREKSVDQLERGGIKNAHFWRGPPCLHHHHLELCLTFTPYILCTWPIALPFDFSFLTLLPCFVTYTPFLLNLFFLPIHSPMKCWQFMSHCTCTHPCGRWPCHLG